MEQNTDTSWHFFWMIFASLILFFIVFSVVLEKKKFAEKKYVILFLSIVVVVIGMLFGKYGANLGLPWWIYYSLPMLMNVLLPPLVLRMNIKKTILYLFLSFLSAPLIHIFFSLVFGWTEYMPFWQI